MTLPVRVKICGIQEPRHAVLAAEQGADFVGMVFVRSPRFVIIERGREIARALNDWRRQHLPSVAEGFSPPGNSTERYSVPLAEAAVKLDALLARKRPLVVGVFADREIHELRNIVLACGIDVVQLSGDEPWAYCDGFRQPVIKVIKVRPGQTADDVVQHIEAGASILEHRGGICIVEPYVRQRYGGTGTLLDWGLAADVAARVPVMLAGGLKPETVGAAVAQVRPWGVDVSSGVETNQVKDESKIAAFLYAARSARMTP